MHASGIFIIVLVSSVQSLDQQGSSRGSEAWFGWDPLLFLWKAKMSSSGMGRGVPSLSYLFSISSAEHGVTQFPRCPNFLILDRLSGLVTCLNHGKVGCFFFYLLPQHRPARACKTHHMVGVSWRKRQRKRKKRRKKKSYLFLHDCMSGQCVFNILRFGKINTYTYLYPLHNQLLLINLIQACKIEQY